MEARILAEVTIAGCRLQAVQGDMTEEQVDAIVNAANSRLMHGGGLAEAIVRRGGDRIQEESDRLAPVEVGHAVSTSAGALQARWVIHAVGPRLGEGDEEAKLRSAVRASLDEARRLGARSVALPAISTGIFGYPKPEGTRVLVDESVLWLRSNPSTIYQLRFTAFDTLTAELLASAVGDDELFR